VKINKKSRIALKRRIKFSIIGRSMLFLNKKDRIKICIVAVIQIFFSLLDLFSVVIIGILGALSISGVQSQEPTARIQTTLKILNLSEKTFQYQFAFLGILAAGFLILKTILSMFLIKKTLYFLAHKAATMSAEFFSRMLNQDLLHLQLKSNQEKLFSITEGIRIITVNIIGNSILLISDFSLLTIMFIGLLVLDTYVALVTLFGFGVLAFILYKRMSLKAQQLGKINTETSIKSNELILEAFNTFRENLVRNRRFFYTTRVSESRREIANSQAELAFMPNVSKYIIESATVLGGIILCAIIFLTKDAVQAFSSLALFLGAVSRIVPAILRIQQGSISIKSGIGFASSTFELIDNLTHTSKVKESLNLGNLEFKDFESTVAIEGLSLIYPEKSQEALSNINLILKTGTSTAIVGPSGAGKTSLVDVILGIINPTSGHVKISGLSPLGAIDKWPGAIGYVPQNTIISQGSIKSNITLGYPEQTFSDQLIWEVVEMAQLKDFVLSLPNGLDTVVGEMGHKISGGQRQRLGIARALITKPKLLILDEATSSLDSQVENSITESINSLSGSLTTIVIAHRLSTVRNSDLVVFLENGKVVSTGSFEHVKNSVPNFDMQAKLMGL
jgi:ABC-type multidrug transport system fused ATPase/permease subunit